MRLSRGPFQNHISPFLGQVPLRVSGVRRLGQAQPGPVTTYRALPEPSPNSPFENFNPVRSREELDRRAAGAPHYAAKKAECEAANETDELAKAAYQAAAEDAKDAALAEWGKTEAAYNKCQDELRDIANYIDFGGTVPWATGWEWPQEIPQPTDTSQFQPKPPTASEVLQNAPPEPLWVPSTDWRFENCPPGTQRTVQGGECINPQANQSTSMQTCPVGSFIDPVTRKCRGSVSSVPNLPGVATGTTSPMSVTSAMMGRAISVTPLYRGRF